MNILLVYPSPSQESPQKTPPLSILYIGAYCERRGYVVDYFDERSDSDFAAKLEVADVVGVSSMSGYQLSRALDFLKRAKAAGKVTILGGVHATIAPATCEAVESIDYIVRGEGEKALLGLLQDLEAGNPPTDKVIITYDPLSPKEMESPITEKTISYFMLSAKTDDVMLPASRGCGYSCGFCYNASKPDGGKWRPLPMRLWLQALDTLISKGVAIRFLQIGDDWLGPKKRILQIGQALVGRGISWHPSVRANQIDEEFVAALSSLGCEGVSIGAESGCDDILRLVNKRISVQDTINAALLLHKYGIKPLYYFILGFPTETWEQQCATLALADRLYAIHEGYCSIAFYGYDPLMGTPLYELARSIGMDVPKTLEDCCKRDRSNTPDPLINAIYYIAGLTFHRTRGDKTDKNFPGVWRVLICPFERLCVIRWKHRKFKFFSVEQAIIKWLLKGAVARASVRNAS